MIITSRAIRRAFKGIPKIKNKIAKNCYDSDLVVIDLNLNAVDGASEGRYGVSTIKGENVSAQFYLDEIVDPDRKLYINFMFRSENYGARTTDGLLHIIKFSADGSGDGDIVENWTGFDAIFSANFGYYPKTYTMAITDLEANHHYHIGWANDETDNGNATICWLCAIQIRYYHKGVIPA